MGADKALAALESLGETRRESVSRLADALARLDEALDEAEERFSAPNEEAS